MGFWFVHIRMPTAQIHLEADRRLAFQVLTAWGALRPDGTPTSKVLERSGDRLLCEFYTPVRILWRLRWLQRTVEWVTATEPSRIEFEGVKAPVPVLLCAFSLDEWGGGCLFKYDATIALHSSFLGWIFGILFVRPMFKRMMSDHLNEMKATIEARAVRSRVYPQQPCPPVAESVPGTP